MVRGVRSVIAKYGVNVKLIVLQNQVGAHGHGGWIVNALDLRVFKNGIGIVITV